MQWQRGFQSSKYALMAALAASSALYGIAQARSKPAAPAETSVGQANASEPEPPQEVKLYDEVGQAVWPGAETAPGDGAPLGPSAIWIAHKSLPIPSFVEMTRLDTGRTIVARVSARPALGRTGALVELSPGAARQLLLDPVGQAPLRIRIVNPTEPEKAALRMGQAAGDRLDTPESLLIVLRKKAGTLAAVSTASRAATEVQPPARPKPAPKPVTPTPDAGPRENTGPHWVVTRDNAEAEAGLAQPTEDGFVVEDASSRRPAPRAASPWKRPTAAPQPIASTGGYYVQVAALSSRWKAQQLASQIGGGIQPSGNLYRVRKGPYASEAAARAALGPLAAKGYRDARITR